MNKQITFNLTTEYIQLDQLLKACNIVGSGGEAHRLVEEGLITVNGKSETRKRAKLRIGDCIALMGITITIE